MERKTEEEERKVSSACGPSRRSRSFPRETVTVKEGISFARAHHGRFTAGTKDTGNRRRLWFAAWSAMCNGIGGEIHRDEACDKCAEEHE